MKLARLASEASILGGALLVIGMGALVTAVRSTDAVESSLGVFFAMLVITALLGWYKGVDEKALQEIRRVPEGASLESLSSTLSGYCRSPSS